MKTNVSTPNLRVLIADDSTVVREQLENMLTELGGIEIIGQAGTVQEAIELILRLNPDVVTLDIQMPGGNGFDVLRAIRRSADESNPGPVVMILSHYSDYRYRERAMQQQASFFFDKSTEFEQAREVFQLLSQSVHPFTISHDGPVNRFSSL